MTGTGTEAMGGDRHLEEREQMVRKQLRQRGISDEQLLKAFREVKRHLFVPDNYQDLAYSDQPLPIGYDQTISQPYIVAFMTEALDLKETDRVLEVGTGSGYQAAILAEICRAVYTIEIIPSLGETARQLLNDLDYTNVHVKIGDGYEGWAAHAPYDAIIVTCSPTHVPKPLKEQLTDGGRMIIPVGKKYAQELVRLRKKEGELVEESVLPVRFVPMVDDDGKRY
ncbi:MAG TPA: protein-L-isoaspartate(D-aspartate) O-methyltransferase [Desulfosalsimonadaceae bacterium]|nr:protein-L-isoaspartate(D-aspartate) O-methyltransferase [Desulfosalsimonadaceae bacterium]